MRFFLLSVFLLFTLPAASQSRRVNPTASASPTVAAELTVKQMYDEANSYNKVKFAEYQQKKIAYSWRYAGEEGDSLVTFELFPEGDKTRLKLTHEGLETFPKLPAYARTNFETGWTEIIGSSLKQYVEGSKTS